MIWLSQEGESSILMMGSSLNCRDMREKILLHPLLLNSLYILLAHLRPNINIVLLLNIRIIIRLQKILKLTPHITMIFPLLSRKIIDLTSMLLFQSTKHILDSERSSLKVHIRQFNLKKYKVTHLKRTITIKCLTTEQKELIL
jgi:hypothetical protein